MIDCLSVAVGSIVPFIGIRCRAATDIGCRGAVPGAKTQRIGYRYVRLESLRQGEFYLLRAAITALVGDGDCYCRRGCYLLSYSMVLSNGQVYICSAVV